MTQLEKLQAELSTLRLSDQEVAWFGGAAEAVGLPIAVWVRSVLRRDASRFAPIPAVDQPPRTPVEIAHRNKGGRPQGSKNKRKAESIPALSGAGGMATAPLPASANQVAYGLHIQPTPVNPASREPTAMYAEAVRRWQSRDPWELPDGTIISDRGPKVTDFTKGTA